MLLSLLLSLTLPLIRSESWNSDIAKRVLADYDNLGIATKTVLNESISSQTVANRKEWWNAYCHFVMKDGDVFCNLAPFFKCWLEYSPIPEMIGEPKTSAICPNDPTCFTQENPCGHPSSPGFYIEKYDWLMNTPYGLAVNGFDNDYRDWFMDFLNDRGEFIKSKDSWPNATKNAWFKYEGTAAHPFNISEYAVPDQGFQSFNGFFLRWPKEFPELNITEDDLLQIRSPSAGGMFMLTDGEQLPGKSDKFHVLNAFGGFGQFFEGGPLIDTLLWFTDFHHFFSPVSGQLIEARVYPGSFNYDFDDYDPWHPDSPLSDVTNSTKDSDKVNWYHELGKHKRFVWIFKTKFGLVGVAAIGFWGVGGIVTDDTNPKTWGGGLANGGANREPPRVGSYVKAGDYLGHFAYNGSSIVMAFQPEVNNQKIDYTWLPNQGGLKGPNDPTLVKARQLIGNAAFSGDMTNDIVQNLAESVLTKTFEQEQGIDDDDVSMPPLNTKGKK